MPPWGSLLMPEGHTLFLFSVDGHNGLSAVHRLIIRKYRINLSKEVKTLVECLYGVSAEILWPILIIVPSIVVVYLLIKTRKWASTEPWST